MRTRKHAYITLGALLALVGCGGGGGGSQSTTGALRLVVKWPTNTKLIPVASNSIKATLLNGSTQIGSQLLPKPTGGATESSVTFNDIAVGTITFKATAYPGANAAGVAQADGSAPVTVVAGQTATITVTMASTIDHITVTPSNPSVAVSANVQLTMTAFNLQNEVILTSPSKVTWLSGTTAKATVDGVGKVTGIAAGTSLITVTATESGKTANTTVTVTAGAQFEQGIFIADSGNNRIVRVDDMSGANFKAFGALGSGVGQFKSPFRVALDSQGRIYVDDFQNNRIVRMNDMNGAGWVSIGTKGSGVGQFDQPFGVFVDAAGKIYVADANNGRIVRMDDMTGAGWTSYGVKKPSVGAGNPGEFNFPYNVSVSSTGHIYVADAGGNQVVRFDDMTGANWVVYRNNNLIPSGLFFPTAIVEGPGGKIYVGDQGNRRLIRIDNMSGANAVVLKDVPNQAELSALDVRIPSNGKIYLAGAASGKVYRFDDMAGAGFAFFGSGQLSGGVSGIFVIPKP